MLEKIGAGSLHELFQSIPLKLRLEGELNISPALTEIET
jgi:glycine cleavage system pyridoxal-binding protein P